MKYVEEIAKKLDHEVITRLCKWIDENREYGEALLVDRARSLLLVLLRKQYELRKEKDGELINKLYLSVLRDMDKKFFIVRYEDRFGHANQIAVKAENEHIAQIECRRKVNDAYRITSVEWKAICEVCESEEPLYINRFGLVVCEYHEAPFFIDSMAISL